MTAGGTQSGYASRTMGMAGADTARRARERSRRARDRQLAYQEEKAERARGREADYIRDMRAKSAAVRAVLEQVRPIPPDARVLEVGSGAHGLVFFFGSSRATGCDPLAREYADLFPAWQRRVATLSAEGESLPFPDAVFDVVLCDNVVDHALDPGRIVSELARVLSPGGLLFFTVNVHHRVYEWAARAVGVLEDAGVKVPIAAFADHTVHLTPDAARALFAGLPLDIVETNCERRSRRGSRPRRATDVITALFFKNALFHLVAVRTPSPATARADAGAARDSRFLSC